MMDNWNDGYNGNIHNINNGIYPFRIVDYKFKVYSTCTSRKYRTSTCTVLLSTYVRRIQSPQVVYEYSYQCTETVRTPYSYCILVLYSSTGTVGVYTRYSYGGTCRHSNTCTSTCTESTYLYVQHRTIYIYVSTINTPYSCR